jgi:hypothetical protein
MVLVYAFHNEPTLLIIEFQVISIRVQLGVFLLPSFYKYVWVVKRVYIQISHPNTSLSIQFHQGNVALIAGI